MIFPYFPKQLYTTFILLMITSTTFGQHLPIETLSYKILYSTIDSLEEQPKLQEKYIKAYISKAKKENNPSELIEAYRTKIYNRPPAIAFQYTDSILAIAEASRNERLLGIAYQTRSTLHYTQKDYKASLEDGLQAETYFEQTNDFYNLYKVKNNIARIKYHTESFNQALVLFLKCADYYKTQEGDNNLMGYINSILFVNRCYYQIKEYQKAQHYIEKGIEASKILTSSSNQALWLSYFKLDEAKIKFEYQDYQQAIFLLQKALPPIQENDDFFNVHLAYLFLGKSYWNLDNKEEAIPYFKKIDALFQEKLITSIELREVYPYLIEHYEEQKNLQQQLHYTKTLLRADSLLHKDQRYITNYFHNKYDNKDLLESTEILKKKIKNHNIKLAITGIILLLIVGSTIYLILKSKKTRTRYQQLIEEKEIRLEEQPIKQQSNVKAIKPEIVEYILSKLSQFEEEKGFLEPNLTQASLAKKWNTNTSYLSKVINTYNHMSFSQYLNHLRVRYAKEKIETDSNFRSQKITVIASELGYNNPKSFVSAFKSYTNLDPSDFIERTLNQIYNKV